ncbi:hypothetical protein A5906_30045 [Bradyrhizobium sacchari]|uniref:DUF6894 domain-containing protein n=1 Tax=Bradyrhizobium sacchari TaxID=1399419 RepID=A0A560JSH5_9BRAD|nr:hypothetical protein [Bradyrhizobium sacchari]OPY98818.1 hypothetical protein A5906_30045 [Bradyrhizobium sacchari]TWB60283.1 hypothetical protein FBZ94_104507 [Bradyrhizobium sacchari]TWB73907.1 hypothetical protein FBZ95_105158 [Bradyrhizobium sacchari]
MPRYYFNIHNGHPFEDRVGEDLPDEEAAWKNALLLTRDIEDVLAPGGAWRLEVIKTDGSPLYRIDIKAERANDAPSNSATPGDSDSPDG